MRSSFYNEGVIDALAAQASVGGQSRVVDVGTSRASLLPVWRRRPRSVVGVDSSPAMLAVAASNVQALGLGNVTLSEGSLDALALEDESVEAAVANVVLHHAEDPAAMLSEMARVVRLGGMVEITDEVEHGYAWMRTEQADLWLGFAEADVKGGWPPTIRRGLTTTGWSARPG